MTQTHRSGTRMRAVGLTAAVALLVAACSGSTATTAPTAPPASSAGAPASAAVYQVTVGHDAKLGAYLAGEDGKSLYLLTKDSANTPTCVGGCASKWPPFELEGTESVTAGDGVTGTLATIKRADDGKVQVTYNGIPLYYFASDTKAGDINGQGVNGVWYLVAPASTAQGGHIAGGVGQGAAPSAAPSSTPSPSPSPSSGGYGYRGSPTATPRPASSQSASAAAGGTPSASVGIADFAYAPASITVKVGSTVTWTNRDSAAHTVTADDGSFGSKAIATGGTFSRTFLTAGTYTYHCAIHPSMTATIVVP